MVVPPSKLTEARSASPGALPASTTNPFVSSGGPLQDSDTDRSAETTGVLNSGGTGGDAKAMTKQLEESRRETDGSRSRSGKCTRRACGAHERPVGSGFTACENDRMVRVP